MPPAPQDLRFALRALAKTPGLTAVAVLTLALGLGLSVAVFSLLNGILLRALPYPGPERLVDVALLQPPAEGRPGGKRYLDDATIAAWKEDARTAEHVAAYREEQLTLLGSEGARRVRAASVTPSLFPLLRVPPELGRTLHTADEAAGAAVVLSHGLWQRRFGGGRSALGETLILDGEPHTVVGVMPQGFHFPEPEIELWRAMALRPAAGDSEDFRQVAYLPVVARLAEGASRAQLAAEVEGVHRSVAGGAGASEDETAGARVRVVPLRDERVAEVRPALLALFGAVVVVLLIACANLANLLLARIVTRRQELAIRAALGSSRGALVRLLLTEALLVALAGGALGIALAAGVHRLLPHLLPEDLPRLEGVALDGRVFLFALALSLLTGVLVGLWPALRSSRPQLVPALQGGIEGGAGGRRGRKALVVLEVTLTVVLLVGGGLLVRSFLELLEVEPGYEPENVLTATLELDQARHPAPQPRSLFDRLLTRLQDHPQVRAAGVVSFPPLTPTFSLASVEILGRPPARTLVVPQLVSPGYLRALQGRLQAGRWLTEADHRSGARVAVVNETFVRQYLAGEEPLGQRVKLRGTTLEIVGVVQDVRLLGLDAGTQPELFTSYHLAEQVTAGGSDRLTLLVRTAGEPEALLPFLRAAVADLDPSLPLEAAGPLDEKLAASVARPRFYALLLGLFAGLALLLAALGIYGVLAYHVSRRAREIGVRRALGAQQRDVLRLVMGEGLGTVALGLGLGLVLAALASRMLESLIFGIPSLDAVTFTLAGVLLLAVAALACYLPARRALRVEPLVALRPG